MSHTNSTTNYNLPQFVGTDKPTWLNDVNGAMSAIDTQMKANADAATSAGTSATTANTSIGTLANLTTTEKTNLVGAINETNTTAGQALNTAGSAVSTATQADGKADALAAEFNLNTFNTYTDYQNWSKVSGTTTSITDGKITVARNTSGSLCKVYGYMNCASTADGSQTVYRIVADSGLRPSEEITVEGCALRTSADGSGYANLIFHTNGAIDVQFFKLANKSFDIRFFACLIFVKPFGDTGGGN